LTRARTGLFAKHKTIKLGFDIYSKVYVEIRVAEFAWKLRYSVFVNVLNKCTKYCQKKGNRIGMKLVRCIFLVINKSTKYCKKKATESE